MRRQQSLTIPQNLADFHVLESTSTTQEISKKPTNIMAVRKGFSDARRRALRTQGVVTMERVRANQATMKSLP
jgi:hypothetical protein